MNEQKLIASVKAHEGFKLRAYKDTKGVWTAGYGRNLEAMTITQHVADEWISEDIYTAQQEAKKFAEYPFLDADARQNAFIEMVYNLGAPRLRNFVHTLAAIKARDWETAANEMLASDWADQVGKRAWTLAKMMRSGNFPD